jgi:hypothetical protein
VQGDIKVNNVLIAGKWTGTLIAARASTWLPQRN